MDKLSASCMVAIINTLPLRLLKVNHFNDGSSFCFILQFHGFFKGMSFPVISVALSNAVVFGSYCNALDYLSRSQQRSGSDQHKRSPLTAVFIAGCFSGLAQARLQITKQPKRAHCVSLTCAVLILSSDSCLLRLR